MGCRAIENSRKWDIAQLKCRATGLSRRWDIAQLKWRASEKSRKWDVAQMRYRAKKCRANDVNPSGVVLYTMHIYEKHFSNILKPFSNILYLKNALNRFIEEF